MKLIKITALSFIMVFSNIIASNAHLLWVSPAEYSIKKGNSLKISFPYAHDFPATKDTGVIEKEQLESLVLYNPEGKSIKLGNWKGTQIESGKLNTEGVYIVATVKKGGFFTKTTEGKYEKKPKNEVLNVVKSTYSKSFNKSIITVGNASGNNFNKVIGHDMEIIPLNNPSALKQGDEFYVKILFNGKPCESEIEAVYDSFKKEKDMFAYKVKSDKSGEAKIKLTHSGSWLLKVNNKVPYSDPKKADEQSYTATLTFSIK